jgi:hypothetical protein
MFNWIKTQNSLPPFIAVVNCDDCGVEMTRKIRRESDLQITKHHCKRCTAKRQWQDPKFRELVVSSSRKIWNDEERRTKMSKIRTDPIHVAKLIERNKTIKPDPIKASIAAKATWQKILSDHERHVAAIKARTRQAKEAWTNDEFRNKVVMNNRKNWQNDEYRTSIVESSKELWKNKEYRDKILNKLQDPEYRIKMAEKMRNKWRTDEQFRQKMRDQPKVSSIQKTLYSILDDLKINYFKEREDGPSDKECMIGPYQFDCVIPRGNKTLLIECQGDYWHSKPDIISRDAAKSSYIMNNFPNQYEIRYLWEHEFSQKDRIVNTIKHWLDINQIDVVDFESQNCVSNGSLTDRR